jgi:hypothetical protein
VACFSAWPPTTKLTSPANLHELSLRWDAEPRELESQSWISFFSRCCVDIEITTTSQVCPFAHTRDLHIELEGCIVDQLTDRTNSYVRYGCNHRHEWEFANHCSKARDTDDEPAGSAQDEKLSEPVEAPTIVVTQHDDYIVHSPSYRDNVHFETSKLAPEKARPLRRSPPSNSVLSAQNEPPPRPPLRRATGLPNEEAPTPKPPRKRNPWVRQEPAETTKRKRNARRPECVAQSPVLPSVKWHVPYDESRKSEKTTVDLVIVYMYHGAKNANAHTMFFECPETEHEPNVHRGRLGASLMAPGQDVQPQPLQVISPPPKEASAGKLAQEKARNWLKNPLMLPEVLPHNRTICVGYDLDTVAEHNNIDYEWAAQKLLDVLDDRRNECSTRPVIFMGHGLGCFVVQQALLRRAMNSVAWNTQDACAGILFHHAPVEYNGSDNSRSLLETEKHGSATAPVADANKSSSKSDKTKALLDLTEAAREHSIVHHVLEHGPSEKDHIRSFGFSTRNDIEFQQLSAKIVEWSETHQMMKSVSQADFATVRRLLDEGVNINLRKTLSQETALHVACQSVSSRFQDIDLLVRVGKADVTLRDSNGRTPLHYALRRMSPDVEVVRVLLEAGAQICVPDCEHITPWDQAKMTAPKRVLRLLRKSPLVEGPSAIKGTVRRARPLSSWEREVCDTYQMTATEIYLDSRKLTERRLPRNFSISDAIYGKKTLTAMLDDSRDGPIEDELVCRWYHLPANNMVWAEDFFRNCLLMHPTIWSEQIRDSELPHGRCVIPHAAEFTAESGESILAICMPYVSYEDNYRQRSVSDTVRYISSTKANLHDRPRTELTPLTPKNPRPRTPNGPAADAFKSDRHSSVDPRRQEVLPYDSDTDSDLDVSYGGASRFMNGMLSKEEEGLLRLYLPQNPPLHMRRTLDQYYYYMLEDTRERDEDQVVTRWAEKQLKTSHYNILMVDQLWIWVIKGKDGQSDQVISCFPDREGHKSDLLDDLQRNVLHHNVDKRQPIATTADLVARIVTTCSEIFTWSQESELVGFLHAFEATVVRVGNDENSLLNDFVARSNSLHSLNESHFEYAKTKHELLIKMLDIRPQVQLLKEAKDIRDEIKIVLQVLGEQQRVLEDSCITSFFGPSSWSPWRKPLDVVKRATGVFDRMDKQMEGILDDLKHLLDLQQKQASVWEAESTREVARATGRQGNVMVIFTMVTIIFLPLSFCASFFALDINEFPTDDKGQTNWPLHRLCTYLFGISFAVIIPFIALAFATEWLFAACRRFDKDWLIPWTLALFGLLSFLPLMKSPCSTAIARVEIRQRESYGDPNGYQSDEDRAPAPKPHSVAAGVLRRGHGRKSKSRSNGSGHHPGPRAYQGSITSNSSGYDSEPRGPQSSRLSRWIRARRREERTHVDEGV